MARNTSSWPVVSRPGFFRFEALQTEASVRLRLPLSTANGKAAAPLRIKER